MDNKLLGQRDADAGPIACHRPSAFGRQSGRQFLLWIPAAVPIGELSRASITPKQREF
jgi:hypothetical protein